MKTSKGTYLIEVYDHSTNQQICQAEILLGLDNLIVKQCNNYDPKDLEELLEARSAIPSKIEMDDIILKKLGLTKRKYEFGRMTEARVLYAALNNFKTNKDQIAVYPLENTTICMIALDNRYSNIYFWNKREKGE